MEVRTRFGAPPDSFRTRLALFKRGTRPSASELLKFEDSGSQVEIFTFHYTSRHGRNSRVYRQTVVAILDSRLSIPEFSLVPEHVVYIIVDALGFHDIDFEDRPEFSKLFRLTGENDAGIRTIFNAELTRELEERGSICIQGSQDTLIFFQEGKVLPVESIEGAVADCLQIRTRFTGC